MLGTTTEAELALAELEMGAGTPYPGDERLHVQFHPGAVKNERKSEAEGRPVYDDKDFIRIFVPGDKNTVIDDEVWDDVNAPNSHTVRFRRQWLAYKAGKEGGLSGTPLSEWPQVTRGQVEELAYLKIRTVEALAGVADVNLQRFPGGFALRQKAQDYLAAAKEAAPMQKMRAELEARDAQLAAQQQQLTELAQALTKLQQQAPQQPPQKHEKGK